MKLLTNLKGLFLLTVSIVSNSNKSLTVKWAYYIFFKTIKHKTPPREKKVIDRAVITKETFAGKEVHIYKWGEGEKKVFMHHGWSGRASQFYQFVEHYVNLGYQVIAIDGPAHGRSAGDRSNVFEFSNVLNELSKHFNGFDLCIAHSFGGYVSLITEKRYQPAIESYVFIGVPVELDFIIGEFWKIAKLRKDAIGPFRKKLNNEFNIEEDYFSIDNIVKDFKKKLIIVHDLNDKEVHFSQAEKLHKHVTHSELIKTESLGHKRILQNSDLIDKISKYFSPETV
jgi:pimeloyl-ACP methyl ester carboxylesterase